MKKMIAVIDDDMHINNMVSEMLKQEGYEVIQAFSGGEALAALERASSEPALCGQGKPDLVLLDLMMPGLSGEQVLPRIRDIPVIVMSAKVDVESKVDLLLSGAVDYVTKPFDAKELLARVQVQLRRNGQNEISEYRGLRLDVDMHEASYGDSAVKLTKTEFAILKILMQNPKQVITKSQILDRISADTPDCVESSLKVHVSNLRRKLRDASGLDFIEAVWGIGFKLREILTDP